MKYVANLLVVLGVCISALGASGFHRPITDPEASVEAGAWLAFIGGLVALAAGGLLVQVLRRAPADGAAAEDGGRDSLQRDLTGIRDAVVALDQAKDGLSAEELRDRISELMSGPYFDLTSKSDELMLRLGFSDYARIWEGVATAERLLNRTWSQCTDGYPEEGKSELPHARSALDASLSALGST